MSPTLLDRLYEGANSTSPGNALFREAAEAISDDMEMKRDAERYRWLRAFSGHRLQVMDRGQEMAYYDTALDAAIDREREGDCDEPIRTAADYDREIDATFASVKPLPGNRESEIDSKTPTGGAHGEQAKMEVPGDAAGPATGRDEPDDGLAADDGVAGRDGRGGVGVRGLRPSVVAREGNAAGLVDLPQASVVPGHAVDTGFPNAEQRRYLIELLRAAKCPEPRCTDGSIISTGPDPQNDACQWCYQRHVTIEALQEGHSQVHGNEVKP